MKECIRKGALFFVFVARNFRRLFLWRNNMPFDGEGVFSRDYNYEEDRENDIDIVTEHVDGEFENFAQGLSQTFLRDGRVPMRGDLDVGHFKVKNLLKGTLPADAVNREQLDDLKSQILTGDNTFSGKNTFKGDISVTGKASFSGDMTAVTQNVADNSTKIATTEFIKNVLSSNGAGLATVSLNTNGYAKFANGLVVQWGEYRGSDGNVYFPTEFANNKYAIVGASLWTGKQSVGWLQIGNKYKGSCYCQMHNYENSHHETRTDVPFNWIAVGC